MATLINFQSGYYKDVAGELIFRGAAQTEKAESFFITDKVVKADQSVFAHFVMDSITIVTGSSVNSLALAILDHYLDSIRNTHFDSVIPVVFFGETSLTGLGRRLTAVKKHFMDALAKRVSRVSKLMSEQSPRAGNNIAGLFVFFIDYDKAAVSLNAGFNGQKRMVDDPQAPSRSYLKVEESYSIMGVTPKPNDTVVDLGAAPGGWSYSAAKRGANVIAIDNGPMKKGATDNKLIEHIKMDAFKYNPSSLRKPVWLFCDMVVEPRHSYNLLLKWIENRWCNSFIVNLKYGHTEPQLLIDDFNKNLLFKKLKYFRVVHLYHDREEITLLGIVD